MTDTDRQPHPGHPDAPPLTDTPCVTVDQLATARHLDALLAHSRDLATSGVSRDARLHVTLHAARLLGLTVGELVDQAVCSLLRGLFQDNLISPAAIEADLDKNPMGPARGIRIGGIICTAYQSGGTWYWRAQVPWYPRHGYYRRPLPAGADGALWAFASSSLSLDSAVDAAMDYLYRMRVDFQDPPTLFLEGDGADDAALPPRWRQTVADAASRAGLAWTEPR